ncbi:MAG TPA: Holliday junction resolvase RuvX [Pirellulales bacterium]|jgi:putative Holliday junction resolvase|nr:Holliday junction resolvase RuvX [Pirellulales bacterium]
MTSRRSAADKSTPGRLAGIDYGTVRIGIAVTDPEQRLASPFENYTRRGEAADAAYFKRLAADERIARFVVGLPIHLDGRESQKSAEARKFGAWLEQTTGVPVVFFDERFTSAEAEHHLTAAKMTKKKRRARLDKLAAQILLAAYLESGERGRARPEGLDD